MRPRNIAAAIVFAALAGLLFAGTATAAKAETEIGDVTVEIVGPPPEATYSGAIKSDKKRCKGNRTVVLIHDSDPPFTIGTAHTDKNGNWSIKGPYPASSSDDRIIVKVKQTPKCKSAKGFFNFYEEVED
jgi:hypothetical protein